MQISLTNNKTSSLNDSKFLKLKKDLKLIILEFLPIEHSFYSLITCNKSFAVLIGKFKIFDLITRGLIEYTLEKDELTDEFKYEVLENWEKHFDNIEDRDKFVTRILYKIYSKQNKFCFDRHIHPKELDNAYIQFLSENKAIKKLMFSDNHFDKEKDFECFDKLRKIVRCCSLEKIDLGCHNINVEGAKVIADELGTNTSLQSILLYNNLIQIEGAEAIAVALKSNTFLQKIYMEQNLIGDEGAIAIADAIRINTSLQIIKLEDNQIGNQGAKAIADALRINTCLEEID